MNTLPHMLTLAHITPTDIGFGVGFFLLGVVVGGVLVGRRRKTAR